MAEEISECLICRGSEFKEIFPGNIDPSVDPVQYFSSSRQVAGHWPIMRCVHCGMVMSNPRDSQVDLARIYEELADTRYQSEIGNRIAVADERLKHIARWASPGRLLDLGCSTGIFCGRAAAAGWKAIGLDPSTWSIEQARKEFPAATFIHGTIERIDFEAGRFGLVTIWDVLEHVTDPRAVLQRINTWVVPGGLVMMNLPNIKSMMARVMGKSWVLLLREHLWYFSPDTIGQLLFQNGFALSAVWSNQVRFSLSNIFSRLAQYPGLQSIKLLSTARGLQRLGLRFPMGEMTVIAVKKDS